MTTTTKGTTMFLSDLLDVEDLQREIAAKNVRQATYGPSGGPFFTIFNYTDQCMRDKHWTPTTVKTRGLVTTPKVNSLTHYVVARPWDKFFNYGEVQHMLTEDRMSMPVEVTDKYDGSLGIAFTDVFSGSGDRPRIATRGSLTSDQAKHAQNVLDVKYPDFVVKPGWTMFFEIIYPENRIVLDYEGLDDLVYLGARNIETGELAGPQDTRFRWHGPRAHTFTYSTLERALAAPPRPNSEGMVIRFLDDGLMVKIKQEDYVNLHRLVTGLSRKSVWEWILQSGPDADVHELTDQLPEEFGEWVIEVYYDFVSQLNDMQIEVEKALALWALKVDGPVADHLLTDDDSKSQKRARKKAFAAFAKDHGYPHKGLLFAAYEGYDWFESAMKIIKPIGDTRMFVQSEDVA